MKILIAEDDRMAAETLEEYLESHGFDCTVESDGDGVRKNCPSDYNAVILDINLHGGPSGLELLPEIKRDNPDILAMVITGESISEARVKSFRLGADFFFPKPLNLSLLLAQLELASGEMKWD